MTVSKLLLAAALLLVATPVHGKVVEYDWVIDYAWAAPDCVEKLVISVNGDFPGPNILSQAGDTVKVNVVNRMPTESVVVHWHGMLQNGTPWEDGAAYVSQCPIGSEECYTYEFVTERPGTYFWHGHYGMQRAAGFYGQLIVHPADGVKEPFSYDGEHSIVLNDWWHASMVDQQLGLFSDPFRWVEEPQSLLIEGRGKYNCSLFPSGSVMTCNESRDSCKPHVIPVEAGKTYRLRIANVASLGSFSFSLEGHNFTVVEADGHYVEPVVMSDIDLYSGETYSVLFEANADSSRNYWAGFNVRGRAPRTPTGLAVLQYVNTNTTAGPSTPAPVSPRWDDTAYSMAKARQYVARQGYIIPLPDREPDRQIYLLNTQNKLRGKLKWALNNISFVPSATPALAALIYNIPAKHSSPTPADFYQAGYNIRSPPPYPETVQGSGVYTLQSDQVVDIILQNACSLTPNVSEVHPWHLHGHDFWILGYGDGVFNATNDYASLNYYNPPLRNTAPLFPFGWTVLRFVTDNPGVWPFHCHIESHFHMGMGVIFAEGVEKIAEVPRKTMGCGATKLIHFP